MRISDWSSDVCSSDLDRDDVARLRLVDRNALEPAEGEQLRRAAGFDHLAVHVERVDRLVDLDRPRLDAAGQDAPDEIVAVEQGREEGEGAVLDRKSTRLNSSH